MIHVGQQSAHHCCQGDLAQFPFGAKALVESAQYGVRASRAESCHVQGQAHFGAPASDTAHSFHRAAVSGPRSQTSQGRHLLAVQLPQFGHMSQHHPGSAGTDTLDVIQAVDALLQRGILVEQGLNLLLHRLDLGLEMGYQLGVLPAHEGLLMMLGLGFGHSLPVDQLLQPLGQCDQLVLGGRSGRRRFRLIALAIISQLLRINRIGFCSLASGLSRCSHLGRIGNRYRDFSFVQDLDHGLLIAAGGFTNDMNPGHILQLIEQLAPALRGIGQLALSALQMKLKGSLGDIHSGINNCVLGLHSFDRVLTHPYVYELTVIAGALATVRVWSTGRARLWLGYGLAQGRPRVARAHARRRPPFAQGRQPHFLACARKARSPKERTNQVRAKVERRPSWRDDHLRRRCLLRCSTPARYARLRGAAQQAALRWCCGTEERPKYKRKPGNHRRQHIRVARNELPWVHRDNAPPLRFKARSSKSRPTPHASTQSDLLSCCWLGRPCPPVRRCARG